jgi:hypothetical protein
MGDCEPKVMSTTNIWFRLNHHLSPLYYSSMGKRKKPGASVVITHDYEDQVYAPVEHIVPRHGAPSTSTRVNVLIPVSPDKRRVSPNTVGDEDIESNPFDPGEEDGSLGHIHYIQPPGRKRYQAAVWYGSICSLSNQLTNSPGRTFEDMDPSSG